MSFRLVPPAYWTSRKEFLEREMSLKRQKEEKYWQTQDSNSKYFNAIQTEAVKYDAWTSEESYKISLDAYKMKKEKEQKENNLRLRKNKLRQLLQLENAEYQMELMQMSSRKHKCLRQREEICKKQQQVDLEAKKGVREDERNLQMETLELETEVNKDKKEIKENTEEAEKEIEIKKEILENIEELKKNERESNELKQEQEKLQQMHRNIQRIHDEFLQMNEPQSPSKQSYSKHQCKHYLQRRSKEIQKTLENERNTIEHAQYCVSLIDSFSMNEDAAVVYKLLDDQLVVERGRECEMSCLFNEEAWCLRDHLEREWDNERATRHHLITEFFCKLLRTLDELTVLNVKRQENCLSSRDSLLSRMEEDQRQLKV